MLVNLEVRRGKLITVLRVKKCQNPLLLEVIDNGARSVGIGTGVFRICTNLMVVLCFFNVAFVVSFRSLGIFFSLIPALTVC